MSQYPPPQPYPQQGPPMGPPPMGGPPMYGPPPKKKGIILLVLGLLTLVLGIILSVVGLGGVGAAASGFKNIAQGNNVFIAPGETTMTLSAGPHMIMSMDGVDLNGRTYNPTDTFPNNSTVFSVTGPGSADVPVTASTMQASGNSGSSSAEAVREFNAPSAGEYTISVTNSDGMEERPILILSQDEAMQMALGAAGGVFGLACGVPLAIIGLILLVVWAIVRK